MSQSQVASQTAPSVTNPGWKPATKLKVTRPLPKARQIRQGSTSNTTAVNSKINSVKAKSAAGRATRLIKTPATIAARHQAQINKAQVVAATAAANLRKAQAVLAPEWSRSLSMGGSQLHLSGPNTREVNEWFKGGNHSLSPTATQAEKNAAYTEWQNKKSDDAWKVHDTKMGEYHALSDADREIARNEQKQKMADMKAKQTETVTDAKGNTRQVTPEELKRINDHKALTPAQKAARKAQLKQSLQAKVAAGTANNATANVLYTLNKGTFASNNSADPKVQAKSRLQNGNSSRGQSGVQREAQIAVTAADPTLVPESADYLNAVDREKEKMRSQEGFKAREGVLADGTSLDHFDKLSHGELNHLRGENSYYDAANTVTDGNGVKTYYNRAGSKVEGQMGINLFEETQRSAFEQKLTAAGIDTANPLHTEEANRMHTERQAAIQANKLTGNVEQPKFQKQGFFGKLFSMKPNLNLGNMDQNLTNFLIKNPHLQMTNGAAVGTGISPHRGKETWGQRFARRFGNGSAPDGTHNTAGHERVSPGTHSSTSNNKGHVGDGRDTTFDTEKERIRKAQEELNKKIEEKRVAAEKVKETEKELEASKKNLKQLEADIKTNIEDNHEFKAAKDKLETLRAENNELGPKKTALTNIANRAAEENAELARITARQAALSGELHTAGQEVGRVRTALINQIVSTPLTAAMDDVTAKRQAVRDAEDKAKKTSATLDKHLDDNFHYNNGPDGQNVNKYSTNGNTRSGNIQRAQESLASQAEHLEKQERLTHTNLHELPQNSADGVFGGNGTRPGDPATHRDGNSEEFYKHYMQQGAVGEKTLSEGEQKSLAKAIQRDMINDNKGLRSMGAGATTAFKEAASRGTSHGLLSTIFDANRSAQNNYGMGFKNMFRTQRREMILRAGFTLNPLGVGNVQMAGEMLGLPGRTTMERIKTSQGMGKVFAKLEGAAIIGAPLAFASMDMSNNEDIGTVAGNWLAPVGLVAARPGLAVGALLGGGLKQNAEGVLTRSRLQTGLRAFGMGAGLLAGGALGLAVTTLGVEAGKDIMSQDSQIRSFGQNFLKKEMYTKTADSRQSLTTRQQALNRLSRSGLNDRNLLLGNEAAALKGLI